MSDDRDKTEGFLARWSRLKTRPVTTGEKVGQDLAGDRNSVAGTPAETPKIGANSNQQAAAAGAPARVALPPLDSLNIDSDYSPFLQPHVEESARRAGLRKLLRDPHFNVMDGLDVYIEDFGKADPMPAAMLADQLRQLLAAQSRDVVEEEGEAKPADITDTPVAEAPVQVGQNDEPVEQSAHAADKMSDKRDGV
ncbi:MAG: DUF3306 domain-containing protein [Burkholderiales bacterium]